MKKIKIKDNTVFEIKRFDWVKSFKFYFSDVHIHSFTTVLVTMLRFYDATANFEIF